MAKWRKADMTFPRELTSEQHGLLVTEFQGIVHKAQDAMDRSAMLLLGPASISQSAQMARNTLVAICDNILDYVKLEQENPLKYRFSFAYDTFRALNLELDLKVMKFKADYNEKFEKKFKSEMPKVFEAMGFKEGEVLMEFGDYEI